MKRTKLLYASFGLLMLALGASDALRGVLAPLFRAHFSLDGAKVSLIVTVSYMGNMVFLFLGGKVLDRMNRKKAMLLFCGIWMSALLLFILTDSYLCLLIGMFFAMGTSTLVSTAITLTTPLLFAVSPAMLVNLLFFVQGIGTVGSQSVVGNLATDFSAWRIVNSLLLCCGIVTFVVMACSPFPQIQTESEKVVKKAKPNKFFFLLLLIFGFYFIAEHGVMNWLVSYATVQFSLSQGAAANYTAIFFAGVMLGRMAFSPLVDKLGVFKSMCGFAILAASTYGIGYLFGQSGLWLLAASGVFFSVLYPTLVFSISKLWPKEVAAGVCGTLLSIASLADIAFNFVFGRIADAIGFGRSFMIMPLAMVVCAALLCVLYRAVETQHKAALESAGS